MRPSVWFVIGALWVLLGGCGRGPVVPDTGAQVFVGEIAGSDVLIALVVEGGNLVAYACGGAGYWGSHTGWFYGSVSAGQIGPTTSPRGHRLEGSLDGASASGTFTLPDGNTLRWSAQRARPGTGAGLYSREQDGQLTGLIVTNEGKMAGASRLVTGDSTGLYAPVQVTSPPSPTNPTPEVSVTFPGLPTRNLNLAPVDLLRHMVVPDSPTIIVLLHGATARTPLDDPQADGFPGTRKHARHYWTYPFVAALMGADPSKDAPLVTLEGTNITGNAFLTEGLGENPDRVPASNQCTLGDMMTAERYSPGQTAAPRLTLLLGHRDAKDSLLEQAMVAVDQIYACVTLFEQTFSRKPKLVFVAHSWGGLITRFILSNPTRQSLEAITTPTRLRFPADSGRYDAGDLSTRVKMDYLRNLTYYAVTLATPHEGVRFMDRIDEVLQAVGLLRGTINAVDEEQERLVNAWRNTVSLLVNLPPADAVRAEPVVAALSWFEGFARSNLATNRVHAESHTALWRALNTGPLRPSQAIRSTHAPIVGAQNQLIPIYALGARNPGSIVLDTLILSDIPRDLIDLSSRQKGGTKLVWLLQLVAGDFAYRFLDTVSSPRAPFSGFAPRLDRTQRVGAMAQLRQLLQTAALQLDPVFRAQFGEDVASLLRFLVNRFRTRGLGVDAVVPIYLNQGFRIEMTATVRVPVPRFTCRGTVLDVRLEALLMGLRDHFGNLEQAARAITATNFTSFVDAIATFNATLAADFAAWFAQQIGSIADCAASGQWAFAWAPIDIPAPRVVATGNPVSDGVIDNDGLVEFDSAMGFRLGTGVNAFFDHTRTDFVVDNKPQPGSWYRRYRSGLEPLNHDVQLKEAGSFIWSDIISHNPGPLPSSQGELSVYPR